MAASAEPNVDSASKDLEKTIEFIVEDIQRMVSEVNILTRAANAIRPGSRIEIEIENKKQAF